MGHIIVQASRYPCEPAEMSKRGHSDVENTPVYEARNVLLRASSEILPVVRENTPVHDAEDVLLRVSAEVRPVVLPVTRTAFLAGDHKVERNALSLQAAAKREGYTVRCDWFDQLLSTYRDARDNFYTSALPHFLDANYKRSTRDWLPWWPVRWHPPVPCFSYL